MQALTFPSIGSFVGWHVLKDAWSYHSTGYFRTVLGQFDLLIISSTLLHESPMDSLGKSMLCTYFFSRIVITYNDRPWRSSNDC